MRTQRRYHTGVTNEVRRAAKCLGVFSLGDITRSDVIKTFIRKNKIKTIVTQLRKSAEVERIGPALYRYIDGKHEKQPEVLIRIFRAMYAKSVFCAKEIMVLTDADKSYTYRVIRRLIDSHDLEGIGFRTNALGRKERLFRVKNEDAFYIERILRA